ncbi:hypothetical protein ACFWTE_16810 [Nocardiopsis sp. NPDC058631]|uniref:hypothetical protein n=1 Tax=Nocardiopsis sp. NPDC058631 TaxID=3346566 RepID=UPI003654DC62
MGAVLSAIKPVNDDGASQNQQSVEERRENGDRDQEVEHTPGDPPHDQADAKKQEPNFRTLGLHAVGDSRSVVVGVG